MTTILSVDRTIYNLHEFFMKLEEITFTIIVLDLSMIIPPYTMDFTAN